MNQQISDKVVSMLTDVQSSVAPEITKATLAAARIEAISYVAYGFLLLIVSFACMWLLSICDKSDRDNDAGVLGLILLIVLSFIGFVMLDFNIYNWVGMFSPKIYLAHQLMGHLMNK